MAFKILSIDGGGTRGLIPAKILDCIEQEYRDYIPSWFNLMAGTSTGGIICLGLGCGISAGRLVQLYQQEAKKIFQENFFDRLSGLDEHMQADYQHKNFKKILKSIFGTHTLGDLHAQDWLGGKDKEIMVCSFDLNPENEADRNRNYRPVIFHSAFQRDRNEKLVDLALRTSAGPTLFPIYQKKYIDGGVAMNNPTMAAIAYAMNDSKEVGNEKGQYLESGFKGLQIKRENIHVLSLGTGTSNLNRIEASKIGRGNWGNLQWIRYLSHLITEANVQSTIYYARHVLPDNHLIRIDPAFDDMEISTKRLAAHPVPMDTTDPEILADMEGLAEKTYLRNRDAIRRFLEV